MIVKPKNATCKPWTKLQRTIPTSTVAKYPSKPKSSYSISIALSSAQDAPFFWCSNPHNQEMKNLSLMTLTINSPYLNFKQLTQINIASFNRRVRRKLHLKKRKLGRNWSVKFNRSFKTQRKLINNSWENRSKKRKRSIIRGSRIWRGWRRRKLPGCKENS
jgi:hypothetical protein